MDRRGLKNGCSERAAANVLTQRSAAERREEWGPTTWAVAAWSRPESFGGGRGKEKGRWWKAEERSPVKGAAVACGDSAAVEGGKGAIFLASFGVEGR